jgi:hypothetical protein
LSKQRLLTAMLVALTSVSATAAACNSAASTPSSPSPSPQPTFTPSPERGAGDAIGFCKQYGTVDFPAQDARYTGSPLPLQIAEILRAEPSGSYARPSDYYMYSAWRCVEGHVSVCSRDCDYGELSHSPNDAMSAYCLKNPDASYIPDELVGLPVQPDYLWVCEHGLPSANRRRGNPVDAQGFIANSWRVLPESRN